MYHALLHMKNDIHELCTFDGIPALNAGSLKKLLIPIPARIIRKNPLPSSLKSFGFWINLLHLPLSLPLNLPLSLTCVKNSTTTILTSR